MVSSSDGRMPSGTPCGKNEKAFCVMGKCLEFGPDQTPLQYEISSDTLSDIEKVRNFTVFIMKRLFLLKTQLDIVWKIQSFI